MTKNVIIAAAVVSGCLNTGNPPNGDAQVSPANVRYLCVGMESSKRFGSCPGCEKDATSLSHLLSSKLGYTGDTLVSSQATKASVVDKLKRGVESTPEDGLFMFLYSGHGGQEKLGGAERDGSDNYDEYLCLYDTYMLDDEIWEIVSKCKGRVFMYFDACHSATMYRSVSSEIRIGKSEAEDGNI